MVDLLLDAGLGRPRVLTELDAAPLDPMGAKSGSFDRERPVDVDKTVWADEDACLCLALSWEVVEADKPVLVEAERPLLVEVLRLREAARSNFGRGWGGFLGA